MTIVRLICVGAMLLSMTACGGGDGDSEQKDEGAKDPGTKNSRSKDKPAAKPSSLSMPTDVIVSDDAAAAKALLDKVVATYQSTDQYMSTQVIDFESFPEGGPSYRKQFHCGVVFDRKREYLRVLTDVGLGSPTDYIYAKFRYIQKDAASSEFYKERVIAGLPELNYLNGNSVGGEPDGVLLTNKNIHDQFGDVVQLITRPPSNGRPEQGLRFVFRDQVVNDLWIDPKTNLITELWFATKVGMPMIRHMTIDIKELGADGIPESEYRPKPDDKIRLLDQKAPDHLFRKLDGQAVHTVKHDADALVLFFWIAHDQGSVRGLKEFQQTFTAEALKKWNAQALAVNVLQPEEDVRAFMKANDITIDMTRLVEESELDTFGITGFGTTIILNKDKLVYIDGQWSNSETGFYGPAVELILNQLGESKSTN